MQFTKSVPVGLKSHAEYNEKWLQQVLADDPSLLGLGDLILKDIERRQPRAGRLDLVEDSGLDAGAYATRWGRYRIRVAKEDLKKNQQTLVELSRLASGTEAPPGQE